MPQALRFDFDRPRRLLLVGPGAGYPPVDLDRLAAGLGGMRQVGVASDCDDALRLILMTGPDVIIVPWSAMAAKLLRAIDRLRDRRFSPRVVLVMEPSASPETFTPPRGVATVAVDAGHPERLTDALCAALAEPPGSIP